MKQGQGQGQRRRGRDDVCRAKAAPVSQGQRQPARGGTGGPEVTPTSQGCAGERFSLAGDADVGKGGCQQVK